MTEQHSVGTLLLPQQTQDTPFVSVVIPCLNGEKTIARGIESVFTQTHPSIEIIVVDDASQDTTAEILRSFGDRIRPIFNEKNRGTAGAYNIGTAAAKGEFVLLMASDCYLTDPDYIADALVHLQDPRIAAACGQGVFDHVERLDSIQRIFTVVNVLDVEEDPDEEVFEVPFIETRCDLVRKRALADIGFWFEGLYNSTEDQDISARMREQGYRLLQDKRLKFALDFGQTEDNLFKILKKQYKYANGQAYIFLRFGLGHHTMTGSQSNRRSRIWHRLIQVAMTPVVVGGLLLSLAWPPAAALVACAVGARALWYWSYAGRWLKGLERIFAALVGIACDLTYSASFLSALVLWTVRDPSIVRFGRPPLKQESKA
ncbi:MAG: glycosyltransferase involved in cell wall biosynthesis [Hyphomicrobiaceae bacterium]